MHSFYCFTIKAMILYNLECERLNKNTFQYLSLEKLGINIYLYAKESE